MAEHHFLTPERIVALREKADRWGWVYVEDCDLLALLDAYERAECYETALREIEQWALSRPRQSHVIHILNIARNALYPYFASAPQGEEGMLGA